jgi:hypothetical protein
MTWEAFWWFWLAMAAFTLVFAINWKKLFAEKGVDFVFITCALLLLSLFLWPVVVAGSLVDKQK